MELCSKHQLSWLRDVVGIALVFGLGIIRPCLADDEKIAKLIVQLGSSDFEIRTDSEKKLLGIGEPALVQLTEVAANDKSLEIRLRASRLIRVIIKNSLESKFLGTKFAMLKRGTFRMGSSDTEANRRTDELLHEVTISSPFMIGIREVTQDEYKKIMDQTPSWFSPTGGGKSKIKTETDDFPVDSVSFQDAIEFCNRLSKRDRFPPYYQLTDIKQEDASIVAGKVKILGGIGYRLPSEAEWEYACRAGTTTAFNRGKETRQGNFQYRRDSYGGSINVALGRTTTVGSYKPNAWGIYDMQGNVAEWCFDFYDKSYYSKSPKTDPGGPEQGIYRVLRGGSFLVNKSRCRSASRFWSFPGEGKFYTGFRIARTPSKIFVDAMNTVE